MTKKIEAEHIIGEYEGHEKGPLIICLAGMHGNEPAGIEALKIIFQLLEKEPVSNPDFYYTGKIVGLLGNLRAFKEKKRHAVKDLNRQWTSKNIRRLKKLHAEDLFFEDREMKELMDVITEIIESYRPESIVLLDLHTTTAHGGIFTVITDDPESLKIGIELHAPVIKGLLKSIKGTSLHYFTEKNIGIPTVAVCFESGQHQEKLSVNRAIAAITNCMRTIGCVKAEDVENKHDKLLIEFAKGLPKVSQLLMTHTIEDKDEFVMRPGYKNFHFVKEGELVADDQKGPIPITKDGLLLMPLYQKQGDDGFFLIESIDEEFGY